MVSSLNSSHLFSRGYQNAANQISPSRQSRDITKTFAGLTKFVQTSVTGTVQGTPPFYRLAELYFPSMDVLQAAAASASGQQTVAHGMAISTGGSMVIMIAEEQTLMPEQR
jgi:hypothetical protein